MLALVAGSVLGAATVHLAAVPPHLREGALLGGFFLALAVGQIAYAAALLLWPTTLLLRAGLVGNGAVALLWLYTRTVGIPFGVGGGELETVGVPDLLANLLGVVAVASAWWLLRQARGHRSPARIGIAGAQAAYALIIVAAASAVVSTTGIS